MRTAPTGPRNGSGETISAAEEGTPLAEFSLAKLGIPPGDIVRVDGAAASGFFRLEGEQRGWTSAG